MNITATINSVDLPAIEVPLKMRRLDMLNPNVTLSNDVFAYTTENRRKLWEFPYSSMDEDTYEAIQAVYDAQVDSGVFPTISIPYYGVEDVTVFMQLNDMEVYNDCGSIQNIQLSFRETLADSGSS
jgi:hypothetical protein